MEPIGTTIPYQLEGAASYLVFGPLSNNDRENYLYYLRQYNHYCPNQQVRRDTVLTTTRPNNQNLGSLHGDRHTTQDNIHVLTVQSSKCTLQKDGGAIGVVDRQIIFPIPRVDMGLSSYRLIRNSSERQSSSIYIIEVRGSSLESGRVQQLLVQYEENLRISTMVSHQQSPPENQAG